MNGSGELEWADDMAILAQSQKGLKSMFLEEPGGDSHPLGMEVNRKTRYTIFIKRRLFPPKILTEELTFADLNHSSWDDCQLQKKNSASRIPVNWYSTSIINYSVISK